MVMMMMIIFDTLSLPVVRVAVMRLLGIGDD